LLPQKKKKFKTSLLQQRRKRKFVNFPYSYLFDFNVVMIIKPSIH
jgi:hypothetical protein